MIQSVLLENFLAHKKTEVKLGPGMTVLTGANNCGKSAVVEGLRCVSQNPAPRHFIRHGAKEARVTVTVDDGTKITWVRKKATVVYELLRPGAEKPEIFRKLRKGQVPEEVLDLLRLDPVELESGASKRDKMVDVHIGNQRKPIFLLDDHSADARMAEFFAASTEGAHLISMQKLLKRKMREQKTASTTIQRSMDRLANDMDQLAPLPEIERQLATTGEVDQALTKSNQLLPQLEGLIQNMTGLRKTRMRLSHRGMVLAGLLEPVQVYDTPRLEGVSQGVNSLGKRIELDRARLSALSPLAEPPQPHATTGIVDTVQQRNRLESQIKTYAKRAGVLADLQLPPELFDEEPLAGLAQDIGHMRSRLLQLAKVQEAEKLNLDRLEADIRQRMEEIGNCPLCNGKLDPDALFEPKSRDA